MKNPGSYAASSKDLARRVKETVRTLRSEIVAFAQDLIEIPTENPPGRCYTECVDLIAKRLKRMGLEPRIIRVPGGGLTETRSSVIASYGTGRKKLFFHGHYDVVPCADANQFVPRMRGGVLVGRGSADMKAGLAAMVYAVRVLQRIRFEPQGRICLVFVPDEETGGARGTGYLFDRGHIDGRDGIGMIMPEPTSGTVWNGCRGALSLLVTVKGNPVHVVRQKKGVNAYEQMVDLSSALLRYKKTVERRKTRHGVGPGEAKNSILMLGGLCQCGTNFNVVPDRCVFSIDRRVNPEEDLAREKHRLLDLLNGFRKRGLKIEIETIQEGEPSSAPRAHPVARALGQSIRDIEGRRPSFNLCPGLLETRYYSRHSIPGYAYGPGHLAQAHHPRESVRVGRVLECTAVYALVALKMLSSEKIP